MKNSACFIGHRKINDTPELWKSLDNIVNGLIENGTVNFLFGDRSEFNDLCFEIVGINKKIHPEIKQIKFRVNYEVADDYTMQFLIGSYDESIFPEAAVGSGKNVYTARNRALIDESDVCVFYYDENYTPPRRRTDKKAISDYQPNSGTALAYGYAVKKQKFIINCLNKYERAEKRRAHSR